MNDGPKVFGLAVCNRFRPQLAPCTLANNSVELIFVKVMITYVLILIKSLGTVPHKNSIVDIKVEHISSIALRLNHF